MPSTPSKEDQKYFDLLGHRKQLLREGRSQDDPEIKSLLDEAMALDITDEAAIVGAYL